MIEAYGANTVRLFILSDSPPEKDIQWSETGMSSAYKFIQKFWSVSQNIIEIIKTDSTNQLIKKLKFLQISQLKKLIQH